MELSDTLPEVLESSTVKKTRKGHSRSGSLIDSINSGFKKKVYNLMVPNGSSPGSKSSSKAVSPSASVKDLKELSRSTTPKSTYSETSAEDALITRPVNSRSGSPLPSSAFSTPIQVSSEAMRTCSCSLLEKFFYKGEISVFTDRLSFSSISGRNLNINIDDVTSVDKEGGVDEEPSLKITTITSSHVFSRFDDFESTFLLISKICRHRNTTKLTHSISNSFNNNKHPRSISPSPRNLEHVANKSMPHINNSGVNKESSEIHHVSFQNPIDDRAISTPAPLIPPQKPIRINFNYPEITHFKNKVIESSVNIPLPIVSRMIFFGINFPLAPYSEFIDPNLKDLSDVSIGEWGEDYPSINKENVVRYVRKLNFPVGPKQTKTIETYLVKAFDPENYIVFECEISTPDVPSGKSFTVKIIYSLERVDIESCETTTLIKVSHLIDWKKKSWLKSQIEGGATNGLKNGTELLLTNLKKYENSTNDITKNAKQNSQPISSMGSDGILAQGESSGIQSVKSSIVSASGISQISAAGNAMVDSNYPIKEVRSLSTTQNLQGELNHADESAIFKSLQQLKDLFHNRWSNKTFGVVGVLVLYFVVAICLGYRWSFGAEGLLYVILWLGG
ncbi:putative membrane protein [Smittium mucronatum]|uniref:Putative membrane protein n=1 Tax=Smittium mucronatum TaxID=133383 RepID=A0A1R0GVI7_9FUNG|nr:putative membrane protein [Smittium mucronatum]